MNKQRIAFKKMMSDCRTVMLAPVILYVISDILAAALLIFMADSLGGFGDATLNIAIDSGMLHIANIVLSLLLLVVIVPFIQYAADYVMLQKSLVHDRHILKAFFEKKYEQAIVFNEGDVQARMEDDINALRIHWVNSRRYIIDCVIILSMIAWELISLQVAGVLVLVLFVALSLKLVLPRMIKKGLVKFDNAKKDYHLKRRSLLNDLGYNLTFFKQYHIIRGIKDRLDRIYAIFHKETEVKDIRLKSLNDAGQGFFAYASMIVLLIFGAIYVAMGKAKAGQIVTIMGLVAVLTEVFNYATEAVRVWPLLNNVANRAVIFYEGSSSVADDAIEMTEFESIDIHNLSYDHKDEESNAINNVINNLSFHISAGDKIIIHGSNGSGKTTLIRLICGLITDYKGEILINGKPITKWNLESWHKLIAVSTQQSQIFNCSIKENILLDRDSEGTALSGFVKNDLKLAELDARAKNKNEISQLSGGEKQAISIARALETGAKVIILDEPFNHLDSEKKAALIEHLKTLDCTILIVTHDMDPIKDMNYKSLVL